MPYVKDGPYSGKNGGKSGYGKRPSRGIIYCVSGKNKGGFRCESGFSGGRSYFEEPLEVGAFVKKGTVIAEIDPRDYEIQFSATEAEFRQVKGEAERVIEL